MKILKVTFPLVIISFFFSSTVFSADTIFTEQRSFRGFEIGLQLDGGVQLMSDQVRAPVLPVIDFFNDRPTVIKPLQGFALLEQGQVIPWNDAKPLVAQSLLADRSLIAGYPNQQVSYLDLPGGHIFAVPGVFKKHIEQPLFKNLYLFDSKMRAKLYEGVFLAVLGNERLKEQLKGADKFSNRINIASGTFESIDGLSSISQETVVATRSMQGIKLAKKFGQNGISQIPWKVSERVNQSLAKSELGKKMEFLNLISLVLKSYSAGMDASAQSYLLALAIEDTRTQAMIEDLLKLLKADAKADPEMIAGLEAARQQMLKFSEDRIHRIAHAMLSAAKTGVTGVALIAVATKSTPLGFVLGEVWELKGEVEDLQVGLLAGLVNVDRFLLSRIDALIANGNMGRFSVNQVNTPDLVRFQHLLGFTTVDTIYSALWEGRWAVSLSSIQKGMIFKVKDWFNPGLQKDILSLQEQHFNLVKKDYLLDIHKTELLEQLQSLYLSPIKNPDPVKITSRIFAIVDSSGSMTKTDPKNLRIEALKMMLDSLGENVELTILDFDDKVTVVLPAQKLGPVGSPVRESAKEALRRIDSDGGTAISKGLRRAYELTGRTHGEVTYVLMSDGKDNSWRGQTNFLGDHIKVHTIALSEQADQEALGQISATTGGIAEIAQNATDLHRIFANLFGEAEGQEVMLVKSGIMKTGERLEFTLPIESSLSGLDFQVTLPGSDIDLTIVDPNGRRIAIDDAVRGGFGVEQRTYDIIRVERPISGQWKAVLDGVDLDPKGEPFTLRVLAKGSTVKTHWVSNVAVPEVGESFSLSVRDQANVTWQSAEITLWKPDGTQQNETRTFDGIESLLSSVTTMELIPDRSGIYRAQISLSGVLVGGEPLVRSLDRSFRVALPGMGLSYRHDIDPFIRRSSLSR